LVGESENAVVLGKSAADYYKVNVGDEFTVREDIAKVVGVLKQTDVANIDNAVLMSLSFGQSAFGRGNMSSAVLLTPDDGHSVNEVETDIESAYINLEVKTQREIEDELDASLETPRRILGMINAVAFVVTIVIIMNVMMMSVKEKTREIGTMRAIGTQRSVVILIIFYETLIPGHVDYHSWVICCRDILVTSSSFASHASTRCSIDLFRGGLFGVATSVLGNSHQSFGGLEI
jgi:putative ABC transport system permease protein